MIFEVLTKKEAKHLEENSMHIMNVYKYRFGRDKLFDVVSWYHYHGIDANSSLFKKVNKVSELLGHKQLYYITYSDKNAVWGFKWIPDGYNEENCPHNEFIIYYSKRGMQIQLHPKFRKDLVDDFISFLHKLLVESAKITQK